MPTLAAIEVALTIAPFLLAAKITTRKPARGVRTASSTVALAVGPVLLVFAPIGLRLLLLKVSIPCRECQRARKKKRKEGMGNGNRRRQLTSRYLDK